MLNYIKLIALGLITLLAMIGANYARDLAYQVNALTVALVAAGMFLWTLRNTGETPYLRGKEDLGSQCTTAFSPSLLSIHLGPRPRE